MFDIGFVELLLIGVVALLVLGPERLPRAARMAGLWLRKARGSWYAMRAELERELADDELKRSLQQTRAELQRAGSELAASGKAITDGGQSLALAAREGGTAKVETDTVSAAAVPETSEPATPPTPR